MSVVYLSLNTVCMDSRRGAGNAESTYPGKGGGLRQTLVTAQGRAPNADSKGSLYKCSSPTGGRLAGTREPEGRYQAKAPEKTGSTLVTPPPPAQAPRPGPPASKQRLSPPSGSAFHAPPPSSLGQTCFLHNPTHPTPWPREATAHHDSRSDLQAQAWLLCEPGGGISEPCCTRHESPCTEASAPKGRSPQLLWPRPNLTA